MAVVLASTENMTYEDWLELFFGAGSDHGTPGFPLVVGVNAGV